MGALRMTLEPQSFCSVLGRLLQTHTHLCRCGLVLGRVALTSGPDAKHLEGTFQIPDGWVLMSAVWCTIGLLFCPTSLLLPEKSERAGEKDLINAYTV